ncbi:MAG TPA: hypothetical protein VHP38_01380 [Ruminiclostridium sp.]|nr:hypothetical protein [Ruminiclostridium sp.]
MDPWKLIRENNTSVTESVVETFLRRRLESKLSKRNAPKSRIATPPRLKRIRRFVKLLPEKSWSLTSLFANPIIPFYWNNIFYDRFREMSGLDTYAGRNYRSGVYNMMKIKTLKYMGGFIGI